MAPPAGHGGFAVNRSLIRGFSNDSALRNGYRDFGYLGDQSDTSEEGVEVYKGPASALYGNGKPGGDINVLTRTPDGRRRRDVRASIDRYGRTSLRADLSDVSASAVDGRGASSVAIRLGLGMDQGRGRRQFDDERGYGVSFSMAWMAGVHTKLVLESDATHVNDQTQPARLPLAPIMAVSDKQTLGEPWDREVVSGHTWRATIEHAFAADWRMRQAFFLQRGRSSTRATELDVYGLTGEGVLVPGDGAVRRVAGDRRQWTGSEVSQTEIYGQFNAWGLGHQMLLGLELGRFDVESQGAMAPLAPLGLREPRYGAQPGVFAVEVDQREAHRTAVLYFQDRLTLSAQSKMLLGLRAERLRTVGENRLDRSVSGGSDALLSPRCGWVYTPTRGQSWFASWTQSSRPQLGAVSAGGQALAPEIGQQFEAGLQWNIGKTGLVGTVSLYHLLRRNLAMPDPGNPSFSVASGKRESKGIELELRGEVTAGTSLDFGVEALRATVLKDGEAPRGTAIPGVAPWFASLWLTQVLDARWTAGFGMVAEGNRRAALSPSEVRLPSYATFDLSLAYRATDWRLQMSVGNVFGRRAWVSDGYAVRLVEPQTAQASLSMSF